VGTTLAGVRVCILRASHYSTDGRARKQAASLSAAGATVTLIGIGDQPPGDVADWAHAVRMLPGPTASFGRRCPWRPLRGALAFVGRAVTRSRVRLTGHTHPGEPALVRAAMAAAPDVLHAYNIHTLRAAVRVKRRTGARVVYDCRDLLGDVDYGSAGMRSRYQSAEAALIAHADAVITVSEACADVLEQRYRIARALILHNGPSMVTSAPSPVHRPTRLLFQGSFHANRNLPALVEAMWALRGVATLTLQGFGGVERELREQVAALRLEGVVSFVPPVPPPCVVQSAVPHDVGVICYRGTSLNLRCAVPNKLMDYLGAGLAVVASDLPGHRSVLRGTGAEVLIDASSPDTIAAALRAVVRDPERVEAMKQAAVLAAKRYEWSREARSMVRLYETLARPPATERGLSRPPNPAHDALGLPSVRAWAPEARIPPHPRQPG
jgi:glycosyltransferase involved in cell wall biosynthesis